MHIDKFEMERMQCLFENKEKSVLLVPGDHFGLDKGIRVGFGYDIQKTLKGLAMMEEIMRGLVS